MRSREEVAEMRMRAQQTAEEFANDPSIVSLARDAKQEEIKNRAIEAGLPDDLKVGTSSNQLCFEFWGVKVCVTLP